MTARPPARHPRTGSGRQRHGGGTGTAHRGAVGGRGHVARRLRGDDGRVSLFLAAGMIGVLAIIGLAFDGAGQLRSMQRADNLAAEAARTGGQSIDRAKAIEGGPKVIDQVAARAAVSSYLAATEVTASSVEFPVVGGRPSSGYASRSPTTGTCSASSASATPSPSPVRPPRGPSPRTRRKGRNAMAAPGRSAARRTGQVLTGFGALVVLIAVLVEGRWR